MVFDNSLVMLGDEMKFVQAVSLIYIIYLFEKCGRYLWESFNACYIEINVDNSNFNNISWMFICKYLKYVFSDRFSLPLNNWSRKDFLPNVSSLKLWRNEELRASAEWASRRLNVGKMLLQSIYRIMCWFYV